MFAGATGASDKPALHACRTCHKNNPNRGALVRHLHFNPLHKKAPTKEKPHQCDICSCIFSDQRSLATHIVSTHGDHGNLTVADCATGPETSADLLRENGAGDASSSTWEPAKGLTELRGVDAASAFRDEKTKCPSLGNAVQSPPIQALPIDAQCEGESKRQAEVQGDSTRQESSGQSLGQGEDDRPVTAV